MSDLNLYGDALVETSGRHGCDIAIQRLDDLDRRALRFLLDWSATPAVACDLGCGSGAQGFRFALLGAHVTLFDLTDITERVGRFRTLFPETTVRFVPGDLRETFRSARIQDLSVAYSQRAIHYLRFPDAITVCREVRAALAPGGRFFLSASGIGSELGAGYAGATEIENRFAPPAPEIAAKHQIHEPVCLYSPDDIQRLAEQSGFRVAAVELSAFGNVKAELF